MTKHRPQVGSISAPFLSDLPKTVMPGCGYCGLDWNSGVSGHAQSRNESGSYGTLVVILWVLPCLMIMSIVPQIMHVGS